MNLGDFLKGLGVGVATNNPVSMLVNTGADVADLGIAGAGYLGHKAGLLSTEQLPEPLDRSKLPMSNEWMRGMLGVNDNTEGMVGELAGSFVNPQSAVKKVFGNPDLLYSKDMASRMKKVAEDLFSKGADKDTVWKQTGLYKTPEGKWVGELADTGTAFKKPPTEFRANTPYAISDVAELPQFKHFNAASKKKISDIKVMFLDKKGVEQHLPGGAAAAYSPADNIIYVRQDRTGAVMGDFMHEFQHAFDKAFKGLDGASQARYSKFEMDKISQLRDEKKFNDFVLELGTAQPGSLAEELALEGLMAKGYSPVEVDELLAKARETFFDGIKKSDLNRIAYDNRAITMQIKDADSTAKTIQKQAKGGWADPNLERSAYANVAGEGFARATDKRRGMSQGERWQDPPWKGAMNDPGHLTVTDPDLMEFRRMGNDLDYNPNLF